VLADGRPRRAYRIEDALHLSWADSWRVFPTCCALAQERQIVREQDSSGVDVFSMLATEPLVARQRVEAPPTPVRAAQPAAPPTAAPTESYSTSELPLALRDARFIRLVSRGGIPQAPPDGPRSPNWIEGGADDVVRWLAGGGNVGLLLRGLVVLDIDPKHAFAPTVTADRDVYVDIANDIWQQLRRRGLPDTLTQRTRSGGLHLIYRAHPNRVYAEIPVPELLGDGGPLVECRSGAHRWIILAPSTFRPPKAPVTWLRREPLADAPGWLPAKVQHGPPRPRVPTLQEQEIEKIRHEVSDEQDFAEQLEADGWTLQLHREGYYLAVRPGKRPSEGASATLNKVALRVLHVFSTAAPLPPGNYDAFAYLTYVHHHGDAVAALQAYPKKKVPDA
jgi:hypothetical protein